MWGAFISIVDFEEELFFFKCCESICFGSKRNMERNGKNEKGLEIKIKKKNFPYFFFFFSFFRMKLFFLS